jgi:plastocyanin
MSSRKLWLWIVIVMFAAALGTTACGKREEASNTSAKPESGNTGTAGTGKLDLANAGKITGKVTLEGTAPKNDVIKMNADPVCMKEAKGTQTQEFYVVGDNGSLENVFVWIKDGIGSFTGDTPTSPVTIDQKQCRYHPHVFGIRVGQPLEILNSDPVIHNIHAVPKINDEFNIGQPVQGMKTTRTFTKQEVMVPFKCDVHGWMNAYVGVVAHPYFAVTGKDGTFELKDVPPGKYTVEAWHEKLGPKRVDVTVGPKESKETNFAFRVTT